MDKYTISSQATKQFVETPVLTVKQTSIQSLNQTNVARPRHNTMTVATNHGSVCLFHHQQLDIRRVHLSDYSTFEYVSAMVSRSAMQMIAVVIYRPGSMAVSDNFSTNSLTYWNVSITAPLCS